MHFTAVYIYGVTQRMEGVKRNTNRQQNLVNVEMCTGKAVAPVCKMIKHLMAGMENLVVRIGKKIRVFKKAEQAQVDDNTVDQKRFALYFTGRCVNHSGNSVFVAYGKQQQEEEHAAGFIVKENTDQKQKQVFQVVLLVDYRKDGINHCEEHPEADLGKDEQVVLRKNKEIEK